FETAWHSSRGFSTPFEDSGRATLSDCALTRSVRSTIVKFRRFPMLPYRQLGSVPRKRHIAHRREAGFRDEGIYYEEVVTTAGFGRAYSICYHLRPPTRVRKVEAAGSAALETVPQPVLRHHHLRTGSIKPAGDILTGRLPLLANDDVIIGRCRPAQPQR